jgi:hypothetical protein
MWANYDYSKFPIVYIKFNNKIDNEDDFNQFLKKWIYLYNDKKDFTFIFDTVDVGIPNISYCYKMTKFINKLKKFKHQYLQKSLIIVSNKYIRYLLNLIFRIQKPVAPVYIYNIKNDSLCNPYDLLNNINNNELNEFSIIKP